MEKAVAIAAADGKAMDRMFWVLLVAGLLLFAIVTIPPGARESRHLRENLLRAQAVQRELAMTEEMLRDRERALQSDPFYQEAVMRAKMKFTKPGEREIKMEATPDRQLLIDMPRAGTYKPTPMPAPGAVSRVTNWALLSASALLVAGAFIFFDRPQR